MSYYGYDYRSDEEIARSVRRWHEREKKSKEDRDAAKVQAKLETALRLLGESKCPNGNCNRGTLRMFRGSSWDMENDLGPCPHCLQVSEVMK